MIACIVYFVIVLSLNPLPPSKSFNYFYKMIVVGVEIPENCQFCDSSNSALNKKRVKISFHLTRSLIRCGNDIDCGHDCFWIALEVFDCATAKKFKLLVACLRKLLPQADALLCKQLAWAWEGRNRLKVLWSGDCLGHY